MNPHETPFRYDEALLTSCAHSLLARGLIDSLDVDGDSGGRDGSDAPRQESHPLAVGDADDCRALFESHASHYRRSPASEEEERFWNAWTTADEGPSGIDEKRPASGGRAGPSPRVAAFLRSVIFTHEHNDAATAWRHRVALNRFSDALPHDLPLMSRRSGDDDYERLEVLAGRFPSPHAETTNVDALQGMQSLAGKLAFVPLDDEETIMKYGEKMRRIQRLGMQGEGGGGSANLLQGFRESWWWVGGGHSGRGGKRKKRDRGDNSLSSLKTKGSKGKENSYLLDKENELGGLDGKGDLGVENDGRGGDWSRRLDWATEENPDGVPVVHPAIDQGLCGSCWAVSATGTLEASISRNVAYLAYERAFSYVEALTGDASVDPRTVSVLIAQDYERRSISAAELSVQELVDCDARYNQGCAGGNPLLAFYYLHRYGISSSSNYPYTGTTGTCNYQKVNQPIATVETWGILTPDHEDNMEKVLRYIGPVAVGLIGADPAFLAYAGGIYTSSKGGKCDVGGQADHAMLITGYGEEVSDDGRVRKYWIARNSWGSGWGENGYVKLARLGGRKGHRGVCGIAHSPSVALGGRFTKDIDLDKYGMYGSTQSRKMGDGRVRSSGLSNTPAPSKMQNFIHQLRNRLGLLQKGIMLSTMNGKEGEVHTFLPYSMMALGLLSAVFLLYHKRHRGQQDIERQPSNEEESVTTNWSTIGLYNGIHEENFSRESNNTLKDSIDCIEGEMTYLLDSGGGLLYS